MARTPSSITQPASVARVTTATCRVNGSSTSPVMVPIAIGRRDAGGISPAATLVPPSSAFERMTVKPRRTPC